MLALIYLGIAIALGDLLCRRFYRFVSVVHRWAAAILVGVLLSTWFTYLAGLALSRTSEPLLSADVLFFAVAAGGIFWLSRKSPEVRMIEPRAPGRAVYDWVALGALSAVACVLLIGTLYTTKQGQLRVSDGGLARQLSIAQTFALGRYSPIDIPQYASQRLNYHFLFYFQAGNLAFLGLNLAWSVDVLSVLGLTSMLGVVLALGELLFNSRIVGRLGVTFFFFHGYLQYLTKFLTFGPSHRSETWEFWNQIAFVSQRHLAFATGTFLLVLIFLVEQYRQRRSIARTSAKGFVFSGLLLVALLLWNLPVFIASAVMLCCLFVAYCCWRLYSLKTPAMLGQILGGTLTACILAAGIIDLWAVYSSSGVEVNSEKEPLVKGLVFRNSAIYKIQGSVPPHLAPEGPPKPPVTAFQGGHGNGKGQFDSPRAIAIDSAGNIFVADTNNGRIEKFSPSGVFITSIGRSGKGHGQFGEPNGLAVDRFGNIYVAEASNHRVQKLAPDGTFMAEWRGPDSGFYGPRSVAIGPDCAVYVLDQGRNRIVKFSPDGRALITWGSAGSGDGHFADHTSVAVDPTSNKVYVADPRNSRIQVFDSDGKFLAKWSVPEWGQPAGFEDLAIDSLRGRLYASSAHMNTILVFDLQGNRTGTLAPSPPDKIDGPSALALARDKLFVLNADSARVSVIPLPAR